MKPLTTGAGRGKRLPGPAPRPRRRARHARIESPPNAVFKTPQLGADDTFVSSPLGRLPLNPTSVVICRPKLDSPKPEIFCSDLT